MPEADEGRLVSAAPAGDEPPAPAAATLPGADSAAAPTPSGRPVSAAAPRQLGPDIPDDDSDLDASDPTEFIRPAGPSDPWEGTDDDIFQLTGDSTAAATTVIPPVPGRPDATAMMPATTEDPKWTARAGVPAAPRGAAPPEEWQRYEDPHGGRTWWLPIFLGVLALLLIAAVAVAAYLIDKNNNNDGVNGTPTPTATTPSAPATTASPSSPPPTSESPSPSPTLPNLIGSTKEQAIAYLDQNGIKYEVVEREDLTAPAGTVLETDPKPGEIITADTVVKLTVAKPPPTSSPTDTASPTPDATTTTG
jgi:hypothetical protein